MQSQRDHHRQRFYVRSLSWTRGGPAAATSGGRRRSPWIKWCGISGILSFYGGSKINSHGVFRYQCVPGYLVYIYSNWTYIPTWLCTKLFRCSCDNTFSLFFLSFLYCAPPRSSCSSTSAGIPIFSYLALCYYVVLVSYFIFPGVIVIDPIF